MALGTEDIRGLQLLDELELVCSRCKRLWAILRVDAEGAYKARVKENVCWDCEPEGW